MRKEQALTGVFLDRDSMDRGDLDFTGWRSTLAHWEFHDATTADEVAARIASADVVVANKVPLRAAALEQAANLRLIVVAATGTNNVDLDAARARGITVCNVRGYATPSLVQHVFSVLLALVTHLPQYAEAVRVGQWQRSKQFCLLDFSVHELAGRTLGIVGYGELGQAVAHMAECFGMKVLLAQRPGGPERPGRLPLDELLPRVDVLSLHCPLTPATRDLIGARELALLPKHAILINTARGGVVDEQALADALRVGQLGGAGVDVLTQEPPVDGNPLLADDIPNLIVTPHVAWASQESRQRLADEVARDVRAFLAGHPRNVVVVADPTRDE